MGPNFKEITWKEINLELMQDTLKQSSLALFFSYIGLLFTLPAWNYFWFHLARGTAMYII